MIKSGQLHNYVLALDKGDDTSQREALLSLKQHEKQEWATAPLEAMHSLVEALEHQLLDGMKRPSIRQEVATILGNMGPRSKSAIPQLIELLHEGIADSVREAAVTALGKIGPAAKVAVEQLIHVLSNCRTSLAVQVVRALGGIGCADQRVRSTLVNLWLTPNQSPNSQVQVAIALCKLKIDARSLLITLTTTLMKNQDAALRTSAAEALAWCDENDVDVVPALLSAAMNDKSEEVRRMADAGLTQLHLSRDKAIRLCSKQLKDSTYAEAALRNSGPLAVPALIEALGAKEPASREKASRTLGCLGELAAAAVPALTAALRDKDLDVRLAVAKGLWNVTKNADAVVPVFVDLLDEKWRDNGEVRRRFLQTVIEAIRRIGPPAKAAAPALIKKTKDKNRHVSESALSALKEIAPAARQS